MTENLSSLADNSADETLISLLKLSGEAIVITDSGGMVLFANQKFSNFLNLSRKRLDNSTIDSILEPLSKANSGAWGEIEKTLESKNLCRNHVLELTINGTPAFYSVSAARFSPEQDHTDFLTLSIWLEMNHPSQLEFGSKLAENPEKSEAQKAEIEDFSESRQRLEELVRQRTAELRRQNLELEKEIAERKQAEAAEREQRAIAEALQNTALNLNRTPDMDKTLDNILINLENVVPHDSANVMLVDDDGIARVVRYKGGKFTSSISTPVPFFSVENTPTLKRMRDSLEPIVIADVENNQDWISKIGSAWIQSYVAAPIFFDDQILGFLNLVSASKNYYNNVHAERLMAFASHASIAIRNAQLFSQAREFAALEERQRLAREMHDAVSQTLFTASVVAETLPVHWERNPEKGMEGLEKLQRLTKGALAEMRKILLELRPEALANADLGDLIEQLGQGAKSYLEITLTSDIHGKFPLPEEVHVAIYRMAQEVFNNIVKHARATHVHIDYENLDGYVYLSITDNGRGFNTNELKEDRLGLKIMQERAESIGASLDILSEPAAGTNITIIWHEKGQEEKNA